MLSFIFIPQVTHARTTNETNNRTETKHAAQQFLGPNKQARSATFKVMILMLEFCTESRSFFNT